MKNIAKLIPILLVTVVLACASPEQPATNLQQEIALSPEQAEHEVRQVHKARMQRNDLQHYSFEDDLLRVSIYGTVAICSGHLTSTLTDRGKEKVTHDGYTEVWVHRDNRWQLVAEQITPQK